MIKNTKLTVPLLIQKFLTAEKWEDDLEIDDEEKTSFLRSAVMADGVEHTLIISSAESEYKILELFIYSPINVPKNRFEQTLILINRINGRYPFGRLALPFVNDKYVIQYQYAIDIESIEDKEMVLKNAIYHGQRIFDIWSDELKQVTTTKKTAQEIIDAIDS